MEIDIENINTFENRNKVYKTQWSTIYEVIEPEFLKETETFPDDFIKNVRIMKMKLLIYQLRSKITQSEWRCNKYYMKNSSSYVGMI